MKEKVKFTLLFTIFLLPLLSTTPDLGFEEIKVFIFVILISISAILWLFNYFQNPAKNNFKLTGAGKAAALFIVVLALTSAFGIDPMNSFVGRQPYFQGLVLYGYLFLFFILVSSSSINLKTLAKVYVFSALLVSLAAINDWIMINLLGQGIPTYAGRVVSTFGQPNFYAGFLLLTLPFFWFLNQRKSPFLLLGFLITVVAIIISQSRAAFLILTVLLLVWFVLKLRKFKSLIFNFILAIFSFALVFSLYSGSGLLYKQIAEPGTIKADDLIDLSNVSVEKRIYIWSVLLERIKEKPVIGYGLENISNAYSNFFQENYHSLFEENLKVSPLLIRLKDLNVDRAHNYILDLLLFSGVLGLLVWLFLVGLLVKKLIQSKVTPENTSLIIGLFIYLIWAAFQNQSVAHLIYFWLLVGLIDR